MMTIRLGFDPRSAKPRAVTVVTTKTNNPRTGAKEITRFSGWGTESSPGGDTHCLIGKGKEHGKE